MNRAASRWVFVVRTIARGDIRRNESALRAIVDQRVESAGSDIAGCAGFIGDRHRHLNFEQDLIAGRADLERGHGRV